MEGKGSIRDLLNWTGKLLDHAGLEASDKRALREFYQSEKKEEPEGR
ncbi:hypothetical protein LJC24_02090 [Desulfococcaceae bacterium OttesenSCG-928-F15]|nr:hypothetical protein [Desulfococcaceae bacterium OttesenSCG-928-F15]